MKFLKSMGRTATLAASLALAAISATPASAAPPSPFVYIVAADQPGYLVSNTNAPLAAAVQGAATDFGQGGVGYAGVVTGLPNVPPGTGKANNFFVFDISSFTSPVTSASLSYFYAATYGPGIYRIFDATPFSLETQLGTPTVDSVPFMNALEQGTQIGSYAVGNDSNLGLLSIDFNANGIAALNTAISNQAPLFFIGGTVSAPTAPAPLAGGGVLAALAAAIALLVTRGGGLVRGFGKLGTA